MKSRWAASLFLFCTLGGSLLPAAIASAQDSQVQVLVGDVCPNIPGNQPSLPNGMQFDENGNCFTPTPSPQPDACPNIDGHQSAIPEGYYKSTNGNCVRQTNPPKDVCPNLAGTQSAVPYGMQTAANGDCVWPPNDLCPNIPGPQDTIPEGMKYDEEGNCFTPAPTAPTQDDDQNEPQNTPSVLKPAISPLLGLIPDWLKELLKNTPILLAQTLPYYFIGGLGFIALLLLLQALHEVTLANGLLLLFRRKKQLAEQEDSFIRLSGEYLHAAIATMLDGLKTNAPSPLLDATQKLEGGVAALLVEATSTAKREQTNTVTGQVSRVATLRSPLFWIPIVFTGIVILVLNFMFSTVGGIDLGTTNLWLQLIVFLGISTLLYAVLRARHTRHLKLQEVETLIDNERTIDAGRLQFIQKARSVLANGLQEIDAQRSDAVEASSDKAFTDGYDQLRDTLAKFSLLQKVQASAETNSRFSIRDAINNALLEQQVAMDAKKLTVTNAADEHEIVNNRSLINAALSSTIASAIRLSNSGSNIIVTVEPAAHSLEIQVSSHNAQTIDMADQFSDPSLLLNNIIITYLGGTLSIRPDHANGIVVTTKL